MSSSFRSPVNKFQKREARRPDVCFESLADIPADAERVRFVPLTDVPGETTCFAQGLGCSSALPRAEPVFHSLDYQIELVSFRNWIRYG